MTAQSLRKRNISQVCSTNSQIPPDKCSKWTAEEESRLVNAVGEYGTNWQLIHTKVFLNRSLGSLRSFWRNRKNKLMAHNSKKREFSQAGANEPQKSQKTQKPQSPSAKWTSEEESQLVKAVNKYGKNWRILQTKLHWNRSPDALRRFWKKRTKKLETRCKPKSAAAPHLSSKLKLKTEISRHKSTIPSNSRENQVPLCPKRKDVEQHEKVSQIESQVRVEAKSKAKPEKTNAHLENTRQKSNDISNAQRIENVARDLKTNQTILVDQDLAIKVITNQNVQIFRISTALIRNSLSLFATLRDLDVNMGETADSESDRSQKDLPDVIANAVNLLIKDARLVLSDVIDCETEKINRLEYFLNNTCTLLKVGAEQNMQKRSKLEETLQFCIEKILDFIFSQDAELVDHRCIFEFTRAICRISETLMYISVKKLLAFILCKLSLLELSVEFEVFDCDAIDALDESLLWITITDYAGDGINLDEGELVSELAEMEGYGMKLFDRFPLVSKQIFYMLAKYENPTSLSKALQVRL